MSELDKTQTTNDNADTEMSGTDTNDGTKTGADTKGADQKFSQADMDKAISERLKRAEAKHQADVNNAVQKAIADYERKAKMTEAERVAEASKQRETELAKRETELAIRENRNYAIEELRKKNIPASLVKYIATADKDETDDNIAAFEEDWSNALSEAIKDAAKGTAPRDNRSAEDKAATTKFSGTQVL